MQTQVLAFCCTWYVHREWAIIQIGWGTLQLPGGWSPFSFVFFSILHVSWLLTACKLPYDCKHSSGRPAGVVIILLGAFTSSQYCSINGTRGRWQNGYC